MSNQVKMICKLPSGLVIEAGYSMDYQAGRFVQGPNYKRAVLKGALQAQVERLQALDPRMQILAPANFIPSETMVDEELAREWMRKNANSTLVKSGLVAIVEKPADLKPMLADVEKVMTGLEPLNPGGDARAKKIGAKVETADFSTERRQ